MKSDEEGGRGEKVREAGKPRADSEWFIYISPQSAHEKSQSENGNKPPFGGGTAYRRDGGC
jgi:hypothetical protein